MRYFVSPVRPRPLEVNPIVAQLVEQCKRILPSPLRNKEDAVDQRYFACHAKTKRWLIVALLLKGAVNRCYIG